MMPPLLGWLVPWDGVETPGLLQLTYQLPWRPTSATDRLPDSSASRDPTRGVPAGRARPGRISMPRTSAERRDAAAREDKRRSLYRTAVRTAAKRRHRSVEAEGRDPARQRRHATPKRDEVRLGINAAGLSDA